MKNKENELVSIVVLNWNGAKYLSQCLFSVFQQTYSNIETILVDNGSTDKSIESLPDIHKVNHVIKNDSNLGFAQGMNIGFENATGEYIMALNMDVFLPPSYIEEAVKSLTQHPTAGVVMGKEYSWEGKRMTNKPTQSSGPGFLKIRGQGCKDKKNLNKIMFSFGAMGSFPLFRKNALQSIKINVGYYFDPKFETGWEDKDIFFRLHHNGWKFLYNGQIFAYHAVSGSVQNKKKLSEKDYIYQKRVFRNRYYFIAKNYPLKVVFCIFPYCF